MDEIKHQIGTAFVDKFGGYCLEAVNGGYDLNTLYDGGKKWGDFSKVFLAVAVLRGCKSYDDYLSVFDYIKPVDHEPVSKQMFARFTGISTAEGGKQAVYNQTYRHKTRAELDQLRALNALRWIDDHRDQALEYIHKNIPVK